MCEKCAASQVEPSRIVITSPDGSQLVYDSSMFVVVMQQGDGVQITGEASPEWIMEVAVAALEKNTIDKIVDSIDEIPQDFKEFMKKC